MTEAISPELFQRLAALAAFELDAEESEYLRRELNHQIASLQELAAIPLDAETPAASHGVTYGEEITPALRVDVWTPYPNPEKILAQAPESADGYIVTPEIPHSEV
ncbi:MAG: aspartyl/glutamyl-tRNA amidotransferase subunit C [Chloroflexi bacterium]|nr:aspartyl/glutamyl-tRNA amidotransferase subunit C [Chloroflexota bacterium]